MVRVWGAALAGELRVVNRSRPAPISSSRFLSRGNPVQLKTGRGKRPQGVPLQALLIDPELKIVQPVEVGNRHDIYAALGCATVQLVMLSETEALYVDEDGLLVDEPGPFFEIEGNDYNPFAGRGLVIGLDSHGKDVDTKIKANELIQRISFPNIELVGFEPISGTADIYGQRVQMVGSRAVFRKRVEGH